ncbi:acyl-carrier-protein S-malonyltransferase [Parvularcula bermudensis HTCC2503]|uniref:Malonyl CoA-acyl carrier protein transacylase n=1 Tax=Parvularcula bermudensis (strain ATCC BAA-594 / HTCC2503 / KCTC 12087) TaxID=314260 RepID=E0TC40_PARBH|nr:ACP S-malonyltransferase [Parvularcula bermudensis]ADM10298.1 acyl-carrier-protein S-malonyltransferase [Parvularcula bermudensis HTCC2503]
MTKSASPISYIFPGQGSQSVGMGVALRDHFPAAATVFEEADEALGRNLSRLMFEGPSEELTLTENAQPALLVVSIAALRALEAEGFGLGAVRSMAGHSLGEYTAYCAAGAIELADAVRLVRLRGEAMQAAVPVGEGKMAAVLGLDIETAAALAAEAGVEIANDNAPSQIVLSGRAAAIDAVCARAKEAGAKRAMLLAVSAPFHSSLMAPAAERMAEALAKTFFQPPKVPVYSNVLTTPPAGEEAIKRSLVDQVTGRVRWVETISQMAEDGTETFIEVGPGKVLSGLVKRIAKSATALSFGEPDDIETLRDRLGH